MANRLLPWARKTLGLRIESEVNRRLAIVVRNFTSRREDGKGGRPMSDPARIAAEVERRSLGLDTPRPGAEAMFRALPRQMAEQGLIVDADQLSPELAASAARLDALTEGHELRPLLDAVAEVRRFYQWAEGYLAGTQLDDEGAQLAVKLAERLTFLGPITAIGEIDGQFSHATAELTNEISSGSRQLQPPWWGVTRRGTSVAASPGVSLWAANQLGHSNETKIRTVCRALAVHLTGQVAGRREGVERHLVVASPLFDPVYNQGALDDDADLALEMEQALFQALQSGWHVVRVLSRADPGRGPNGGRGPAMAPLDVAVELVVAVLVNLITPGVYEPVIDAPLTTPDVIVARQTAAISFATPASPNPGRAWLPRAVIRAVQWGPGHEMATETVRGLYDDVMSELGGVMTASGERGADGDPYMQKWSTRPDLLLPTDGLLAFDRTLTVSELIPGDRWVIKGGMSSSTMPDGADGDTLSARQVEAWKAEVSEMMDDRPGWARAIAGSPELAGLGPDEVLGRIDRLARKRSVRHFALKTNCEHHRYWDLVPAAYVEAYATDEDFGDPEAAPSALYGTRYLTLADRRLHLAAIVDQLRLTAAAIERHGPAAPGYRMGLTQALPFNLADTWMVITGSEDRRADQVHFVHRDLPSGQRILAILRPSALEQFELRRAFGALVDALWASTPVASTDPAQVADHIDDLLQRSP